MLFNAFGCLLEVMLLTFIDRLLIARIDWVIRRAAELVFCLQLQSVHCTLCDIQFSIIFNGYSQPLC